MPGIGSESALSGVVDVVVVGAGVVGCAIARRFALEGARVAVLEKAADILDGASKGNSAILHTGFDAPPGSLEAACIAEGYNEYLSIRGRLGLPLLQSGALVIAWNEQDEARLPALMDRARENGVDDVTPLSARETLDLEPELSSNLRCSFRVPREFIIDPWSAPLAYLKQAMAHGTELLRLCEVTGGAFDGSAWQLETTRGPVRGRVVINATGLYGDVVDQRLLGESAFTIRPRKGQFVVYDKPAHALTRHILLPVPDKVTKGVVVCRTIWGNLLVGPTAEEQDDRAVATLTPETLEELKRRGAEILPALARQEATAVYAGLRPATEHKDYCISAHDGRNYISVGGIRSTGLSSALGTARHVFRLAERFDIPTRDVVPVWPTMPNLAETAPRDWQTPGHGGIVCHCELVTRREIESALDGPLGAGSLAGLKRRTRATMGRCQGFYCSAELARMTRGRLAEPMAETPGE